MSLWHFIIIAIAIIICDIYCDDYHGNYSSPWQANINNQGSIFQVGQTTPWPSLHQRRNQLQNAFEQNQPQSGVSSRRQPPTWVRPNNGSYWVRNTAATTSTPAAGIYTGNGGVWVQGGGGGGWGQQNQNNRQQNPTGFTSNRHESPSGSRQESSSGNVGTRRYLTAGSEDNQLRELSEELLEMDVNNAAQYITVNYQGMTSSRSTTDEAPEPLLTIHPNAYRIKTISLLKQFYDNYNLDTKSVEMVTQMEKQEENEFLNAILSTQVMEYVRTFLIEKGKIGHDPLEFKDLLRTIWFELYSRGGGKIGSSGFEHVFLAEIKNHQVSGLHNWVYFEEEERKRNANYLGYMRKLDLGNAKGAILKYHFTFHDIDKPVGGMFIGTSPELEIALYTTCFVMRADKICPLKLNGNRFIIRTYSYTYRGKRMIGSAFPEI